MEKQFKKVKVASKKIAVNYMRVSFFHIFTKIKFSKERKHDGMVKIKAMLNKDK